MSKSHIILLGKAIQKIAKLRGGGSALPGLFIEKVSPQFIKNTMTSLPKGIVIVSGTNGKTTTTKMVVELLESQGLKVFTNRTGSNFSRGVAAALLEEVDNKGLINADIAVLELDEAHAIHFIKMVPPKYCLLLNVMRDQLDRFSEIDTTAKLLQKIAESTTDSIILNREDPRILNISKSIEKKNVHFFGLSEKVRSLFPNDDDMYNDKTSNKKELPKADVILSDLENNTAKFIVNDKTNTINLSLKGVYNIYNAAAALTTVKSILKDSIQYEKLWDRLAKITPAFGRGETLYIGGQPLEIVLVKNPSGFTLSLSSFNPQEYKTMIAVNDNYADGRDTSWLWDVDFTSFKKTGVSEVSGIRAYDMALRLQYDEIEISNIASNLSEGIRHFISNNPNSPKRIYCTYTAMLSIRRELAKIINIETSL